jgi:hypothetical protein
MKAIVLLLLLIMPGQYFVACSKNGKSQTVDWPKVVSCTDAAQADLVLSVQRLLLGDGDAVDGSISDRAIAELEALAMMHGAPMITCVVDQAIAMLMKPKEIPPPPAARAAPQAGPQATQMAAPPPPEPEFAEPLPAQQAAALRGRDFLERVAKTDVQRAEPSPQ